MHQPGAEFAPIDVGAFSWPLPNSRRCAFYLDANNSLFVAEFRRPAMAEVMAMHNAHALAGEPPAARLPACLRCSRCLPLPLPLRQPAGAAPVLG